jgi:hypothetical protein
MKWKRGPHAGELRLSKRISGAVSRSDESDPFEDTIDKILASADGDVRRALRAVLFEIIELESELRNLYASSDHGKFTDTKTSLH